MKAFAPLRALLSVLALLAFADAARKPANSVLLSNVKTLTLKKGAKTTHRRTSAVPQLKCIGGNARSHYEIDVLRCTNAGSDYDDANVQWTCKASLPPEFKLGSTDVICEGYDSPEDPYILKGSCGVEYRLMLTEEGEKKYGKSSWGFGGASEDTASGEESGSVLTTLFWILFIGVALFMIYSAFFGQRDGPNATSRRPRAPRAPRGGTNWGGGGDDNDDPPPPYDWRPGGGAPPRKPKTTSSSSSSTASQGWRPGFWSGAAGGAAAGYAASRFAGGGNGQQQAPGYGVSGGSNWFGGGGSSGRGGGSGTSESSSSTPSSARYESTGFGETRRR